MSCPAATDAAASAASTPAEPRPLSEHPTLKNNYGLKPYIYEEDGVSYTVTPEDAFRLATIRTIEWKVNIANP